MLKADSIRKQIVENQPLLKEDPSIVDHVRHQSELVELISISKPNTVMYDNDDYDPTISGTIEIDSDLAAEIVRNYQYASNRSIVRAHVNLLKSEMNDGRYRPKATVVAFAIDRNHNFAMINSNHSLTALSETPGVTLTFPWKFHMRLPADDAYIYYDAGKSRTQANQNQALDLADRFDMNPSDVRALTSAAKLIAGDGMHTLSGDAAVMMKSPHRRLEFVSTYVPEFREYLAMLETIPHQPVGTMTYTKLMKFLRSPPLVSATLIAMKHDPENSDKYLEYIRAFAPPAGENIDPRNLALFEFFTSDRTLACGGFRYTMCYMATLCMLHACLHGYQLVAQRRLTLLRGMVSIKNKAKANPNNLLRFITLGSYTREYFLEDGK